MINFNGKLIDPIQPYLTHRSRAFLNGDILVEEVHFYRGAYVFWESHYFRLMASMRIMRMQIPIYFTMIFFKEEMDKVVESRK